MDFQVFKCRLDILVRLRLDGQECPSYPKINQCLQKGSGTNSAWRGLRPQPKFAIANRSPSDPASVGARLIRLQHKDVTKNTLHRPRVGGWATLGYSSRLHRLRVGAGQGGLRVFCCSPPVSGPPTQGRWCPNATPRCIKIFSGIQSLNRLQCSTLWAIWLLVPDLPLPSPNWPQDWFCRCLRTGGRQAASAASRITGRPQILPMRPFRQGLIEKYGVAVGWKNPGGRCFTAR